MTRDEIKEKLLNQPFFKSNGALNNAWIHHNIQKFDLSSLEGDTIYEKLYLLFHERTYCKICGSPTPFVSWTLGYRKACSSSCKGKLSRLGYKASEVEKEKRRKTCLERYGVDNPRKSELFNHKKEKI